MAMSFYNRILCPPLNNVTYESNTNAVRIIAVKSANGPQKSCIDFTQILKAVANSIKKPISLNVVSSWGGVVNGLWTGGYGDLVNNRSDVLIGTVTATEERFQVMRFSSTLDYSSPIAILSGRIPQNSIDSEFQVFHTFSSDIWLLIFVSILLIALTDLYIHRNCHNRNYYIINSFFEAYQSFVGQSVERFKRFCCLKNCFLICLALLSFNIIIEFFKALILSKLLNDPLIQINSIDDLAHFLETTRNNVTIVATERHSTWKLLEESDEKNFQLVSKRMVNTNIFQLNFNKIYHGEMIAIGHSLILENKIKLMKHIGLHLSRNRYFGTQLVMLYSLAIDKSLQESIDSVIQSIFETGLNDFWNSVRFETKLNITEFEAKEEIGMQSMRGLFALLAIINSTVILLLIIELISMRLFRLSH